MLVKKVGVSLRYSKEIGQNQYKTIEVSTEAEMNDITEDWHEIQDALYQDLAKQLEKMWKY